MYLLLVIKCIIIYARIHTTPESSENLLNFDFFFFFKGSLIFLNIVFFLLITFHDIHLLFYVTLFIC